MDDWTLPEIDRTLCDRCGICVQQCPTRAVEMGPEGPIVARPADCTYCAVCGEVCPRGAITITYEIVWAPDS